MAQSRISRQMEALIPALGGTIVAPPTKLAPGDRYVQLDDYLKAVGVRHFSGRELGRPRDADLARELGFEDFVPPPDWWPRLAALALQAERLRAYVGGPILVTNAWRPEPYNDRVGGASGSDHIEACALDLRLPTEAAWVKACPWLLEEYKRPELSMSLGLGFNPARRFVHLGMCSLGGNRRWRYTAAGLPTKWHARRLS